MNETIINTNNETKYYLLTEEQVRDLQVKSWEAGRKGEGATGLAKMVAELKPLATSRVGAEEVLNKQIGEVRAETRDFVFYSDAIEAMQTHLALHVAQPGEVLYRKVTALTPKQDGYYTCEVEKNFGGVKSQWPAIVELWNGKWITEEYTKVISWEEEVFLPKQDAKWPTQGEFDSKVAELVHLHGWGQIMSEELLNYVKQFQLQAK